MRRDKRKCVLCKCLKVFLHCAVYLLFVLVSFDKSAHRFFEYCPPAALYGSSPIKKTIS